MSEGRGAWTIRGKRNNTGQHARIMGDPRDGTYPDGAPMTAWFDCVHLGVRAIQSLLTYHGYGGFTVEPGEYRAKTREAVIDFQNDTTGLTADGKVGGATMRALVRPLVASAAQSRQVNPRWLWGLATQESAFDPGAQGWSTPADLGLWQFNTSDGQPLPEDAMAPGWAAHAVATRFRDACRHFNGKTHELMISCTIIQHRSPTAAEHLYDHETPYGPESEDYVSERPRVRSVMVNDVTPTPDEIDAGLRVLPKEYGYDPVDDDYVRVAVAAVLPLYRDRLLTELADEADERGRNLYTPNATSEWLRSKVGGSSEI